MPTNKNKRSQRQVRNVLETNCARIDDLIGRMDERLQLEPIKDDALREEIWQIIEATLSNLYDLRCRIRQRTSYPHTMGLAIRLDMQEELAEQEQRRAALRERS